MKISVTIITLNEERNIERCIRSVQEVADEIIVLDAFSSDNTPSICKSLNVRFEQRKWEGYTSAKNYLNSLAQYDYILSMDADEAVDSTLREEILGLKHLNEPEIYSLNRLTNYCGKWIKHSGWYPDVKVRLFPKKDCYWSGEYVHEVLVFPASIPVKQLNGHLEHYSYYSYKEHRERADRYSKLTAQKMFEAGDRASIFKPYLSGLMRFVKMYILQMGFLDGKMGFKIAQISCQSNVFKYKELRRITQEAL